MAIYHIKVNVGRTVSPKHSGRGAVLVTVVTGTTYGAVASGITSATTIQHQIVGSLGENDFWISTGPYTMFAAVSIAHPFYAYTTSTQGISASTVATYSLMLGPKAGGANVYMPKKYMYALDNSVLTPRNLSSMMANSDYQTSVTDRHYVTAEYCNDTYGRIRCFSAYDTLLWSDKLCTGVNVSWFPGMESVGSIYDYDPSTPSETVYPPWTVYFRTSSLVINNSTTRTLYVDFRLWVKEVGTTTRIEVGSVKDYIGPGSNSYSISYISKDWTNIGEFGFELVSLKENGGETTQTLRVTMVSNEESNSISYYGPCVRTLSYASYNSSYVNINSVALDFYV